MIFDRHFVRRMARVLCITAAFSLLAGCAAASPSDSSKASISGALTQPDNSSVLVLDGSSVSAEENDLQQDALHEALNACLGWGPGSAGSSLHAVSAAAALLDWASANGLAGRTDSFAADAFTAWYEGLDDFGQDTFSETWPLVCEEADALLEGADGTDELLESAGADPSQAGSWDAADWDALLAAVIGSGC